MAVLVELPVLGEEQALGVVAEWYLADGATVEPGMPVCRVESSFVAVEVEAEGPGLLRQEKPAGSIEAPGTVLGVILAPGEAMPAHPAAPLGPPADRGSDELSVVPLPVFEEAVEAESARSEEAFGEQKAENGEAEAEQVGSAVVVPFPRRFQAPEDSGWSAVPGDAVAFESSLFSNAPGERTAALEQPGGSIPGLPLWEPEDGREGATAVETPAMERFARIAGEVAASAQVLSMAMSVDVTEALRMQTVCLREWKRFGTMPLLEDIVIRAIAVAMAEETGRDDPAGLLIAGLASDSSCALSNPCGRSFREAVGVRDGGGDTPFEDAAWVVTSVAAFGVSNATPRLDRGRALAFAMGAANRQRETTLTMAYDSATWSESSAARLLARVRDIIEAPYAMLV